MIAAIYARKSTSQDDVAEDAKSVTRQIENAKAFATRKGWTVTDAHVYVDDGISGTEFKKRPAFMRMMHAITPKAPFRVLIVSEQKSIGREMSETSFTIKQLAQAGVEIFEYVHGRSLTPTTPRNCCRPCRGFPTKTMRSRRANGSSRPIPSYSRWGASSAVGSSATTTAWNKSRKRDDFRQVNQRPRPESEWLRADAPHLRIIDEPLWRRVQSRRQDAETLAARLAGGRLSGRPPKTATQNLLAGLATCALCGGGLVVETSPRKRGRVPEYVCYRHRANGACTNALRMTVVEMNEAVLQAAEEHALTPEDF
jgi:hypothetical protein